MAHEKQAQRRQADIRASIDKKAKELRARGLADSEVKRLTDPLPSFYLAATREEAHPLACGASLLFRSQNS